jgi:nitroreductase/NAD-dependent dihydropyrimidine dehydrogenase PreA subunit
MELITINPEKCTLCGRCIMTCPFGLFIKDDKVKVVEEGESKCVNCGHCISICPSEAISLPSGPPENLVKIEKSLNITEEQVGQFLKSNRSIRRYKDTVVPEEEISKIMDVTRYAPSAKNAEPLHWIISKNPSETRHLADLTVKGMVESNIDRYVKLAGFHRAENDIVFRGAPHVIIGHAPQEGFNPYVDCTIGLTYFDLAANSSGIGTCWAGIFMIISGKYPLIADYLKLPEGHKIYGAMMFGYPKYQYHRIPKRHEARVRFI